MNQEQTIRRATIKKIAKNILIYVLLTIGALVALYPVSRVITISLRPNDKIMSTDLSIIPENATFANYRDLFTKKPLIVWFFNSLVCSAATAVIGTFFAVSAGYAFSRFSFPGKKSGLVFLLVSQLLPASMLLLPLYMMISKMQLTNNYIGVIIVYLTTAMPFSIWLMKGYFDSISVEIEEAGMVDGAGIFRCFYSLILPLARPAVAITLLLAFMMAWQDYIIARVIMTKQATMTWPVGLESMRGQFQKEYGMFAAASIVFSIPAVLLFMITSRYLVSGLTLGSIKE